MATQLQPVTADELLAMPRGQVRRELVCGKVREMTPAGHSHGRIALRIGSRLLVHVEQNNLGAAYAAETGFKLRSEPDTVRAADAAFVRRARVDEVESTPGYFPGAPDLAVEVVSPSDRFAAVEAKVWEWLDAGARMVIVVNPEARTATVYRSRQEIVVLAEQDRIDGADVVPGWSVPLAELFV